MKTRFFFFLFAAGALFAQTNSEPRITAIDGYAARVNSEVITYGDIREYIAPMIQQAIRQLRGEPLARQIQQLHIDGREALIEEMLMVEEARRNEFALPEHIIDEEVESIIRERFNGSRLELTRALMERRMTFEEWREEISRKLLMSYYLNQEVLRHVVVTEEEVRAEYERAKDQFLIPFRVKYRRILINKGVTEEEQAVKRTQAEETYRKLMDGADFATVAADVSEGDSSVSPWRDPEDVKAEMRPALRNTPAGGISELIEGEKVFYIIQVESRQEEGYVPYEDVSQRIRSVLRSREQRRLRTRLVERLAAKHHIERF